jgi:hypothetical protein
MNILGISLPLTDVLLHNPAGQRSGCVVNGARGAGRRVKPFSCRR